LRGGKLHCSPEDCGGVPGYYDLLEAIRDPDHGEHADMLEWIGGDFDPEFFSLITSTEDSHLCNDIGKSP
jgi:hypothetical protein